MTGFTLVSCRDSVCVDCVFGKHNGDNFENRAAWHALGPLQLVHSDFCGPPSSPSFYRCNYLLTFIDDFSRRTWVYFLKLKGRVFDLQGPCRKTIWTSNSKVKNKKWRRISEQ